MDTKKGKLRAQGKSSTLVVWVLVLLSIGLCFSPAEKSFGECRTILVCEDGDTGCHFDNLKEVYMASTDEVESEPEPIMIPCE